MVSRNRKRDGKFFLTTKKGEVAELRRDLNSLDKAVVKNGIKRVIADMTVGKDVGSLFPDVIKSMATDDIELKKLVYLYIINYARAQPEKAILVVNAFQKDAQEHPNPLVRALAIRTMSCIRVERIHEYLCDPLEHALSDKDAYVRKTAALGVAKLFDVAPDLVRERGLVSVLRGMVSDANNMVVANAVAALAEISEKCGHDEFHVTEATLHKLLTALNECTEWGQVFILDALSKYDASASEAAQICERITARLSHANAAVVMSAVKCIVRFLDLVADGALRRQLQRKLAPPLVTLLSSSASPEMQFVALRNIALVVQKLPDLLEHEIRVFFCKYNDATYVKMEKLDVLVKLSSDANIDQVLLELREYANEVDVAFVRRAVRAIGRCAVKLPAAADKCVDVLRDLIRQPRPKDQVLQQAVVVVKDILRRYPRKYERIIVDLSDKLDALDEPDAKAALVWILGEYADRIPDVDERLRFFVDNWAEEAPVVQLQLLTAVVKHFLKSLSTQAQQTVVKVLDLATKHSDDPDLRDRAFVYWRLLNKPKAARAVVLADRPTIAAAEAENLLEPALLERLLKELGSLASVYHRAPETFVKDATGITFAAREEDEVSDYSDEDEDEDYSDYGEDEEATEPRGGSGSGGYGSGSGSGGSDEVDMLGMGSLSSSPRAPAPRAPAPRAPAQSAAAQDQGQARFSKVHLVLQAGEQSALHVGAAFRADADGQAFMDLYIQNNSANTPVQTVALRFKQNYLGVAPPQAALRVPSPIAPQGGRCKLPVPLTMTRPTADTRVSATVQMAIKTEVGTAYFADLVPSCLWFDSTVAQQVGRAEFLSQWQQLPDSLERRKDVEMPASLSDLSVLTTQLAAHNVSYIAKRRVQDSLVAYYVARLCSTVLLIEVTVKPGAPLQLIVKSADAAVSCAALAGVQYALCGHCD